jgi:excisionase family DNA binding protein
MGDHETPILTSRQVAIRLGVPVRELYRLVEGGHLVAYRVGRDLRFRPDDVDAYRSRPTNP